MAAAAAALSLGACASATSPPIYDLTAANPPPMRPFRAQIQIAEPVATLDLDSDRIPVRDGLNLSLLPGGRWPQQLSSLFRARLVETFQNAGLARSLAGGGATANYELDLDIRAFELDAVTNQVHVGRRGEDHRGQQRARRRRGNIYRADAGRLDRCRRGRRRARSDVSDDHDAHRAVRRKAAVRRSSTTPRVEEPLSPPSNQVWSLNDRRHNASFRRSRDLRFESMIADADASKRCSIRSSTTARTRFSAEPCSRSPIRI